MCGIAGVLDLREDGRPVSGQDISRMLASIRHRGPDQFGIYTGERIGLGSARLSIIDVAGGRQPLANEDGSRRIVFNGEIFNYLELKPRLLARGHRFTTATDTEVLLHLHEEFGDDCLPMLNGQFAVAIWDSRDRTLLLARDRFGVRPLFYTVSGGRLVFGSEIKALLNVVGPRELDPLALDEIFTFWSTRSPRTAFQGIFEVPPGEYLKVSGGELRHGSYWALEFPTESELPRDVSLPRAIEEFHGLLEDAIRIRLRADVPVGVYVSGGLDSSVIAALTRRRLSGRLHTFSVAFSDPEFDESRFQNQVAAWMATDHHVVQASHAAIAAVFPDLIWHAETPLLRTAPAPMMLLSKLVHEQGLKVVLSGEGADEFLGGYDIFKEAAIRRFWARRPDSSLRPLLLRRLYPDIPGLGRTSLPFLSGFFGSGLTATELPHYSHALRWRTTSRAKRFFSDELRQAIGVERDCVAELQYPNGWAGWGALQKAQFLEARMFLPQYLLSSQGDRAAMAHSVEARFPFLDYRVVEFANRLPSSLKLRVLSEKHILKELGRQLLPASVWNRRKRPYRAPINQVFFGPASPEYVTGLLSPEAIRAAGLFEPRAVTQLVAKARQQTPLGETDAMALAGILSTQLVHQRFVAAFTPAAPLGGEDDHAVRLQPAVAGAGLGFKS